MNHLFGVINVLGGRDVDLSPFLQHITQGMAFPNIESS